MKDYIITRDYSRSLRHYGVRGMRWGERNEEDPQQSNTTQRRTVFTYNSAPTMYRVKKNVGQQMEKQKSTVASSMDRIFKDLSTQAKQQQDQMYELRKEIAVSGASGGAYDRMFDEADALYDEVQDNLAKGKLPTKQQSAMLKNYQEMFKSLQSQMAGIKNKIGNAVGQL